MHILGVTGCPAQIPWGDEFDHETGRVLFGSNLLALTWIKGEPMPRQLVDEILRGLGLERESEPQRAERQSNRFLGAGSGRSGGRSGFSGRGSSLLLG